MQRAGLRQFAASATAWTRAFELNSPRARWLIFGLYMLATMFRMPRVFFSGRLFAEEGTVFYSHAARTPWLSALFFSYAGYVNLGANVAAVVAWHFFPLSYAPRVTLFFSLLAQISPAILLVITRTAWVSSNLALFTALFLLVSLPAADEVWLNTLHSQFFMCVSAALILALDTEPGWGEVFRRCLLFLAPLYGLPVIILVPLFFVRSVLDRSGPRFIQFLIIGVGAAIQLLLFKHYLRDRFQMDTQLVLASLFAKNMVLPFLSYTLSDSMTHWLRDEVAGGILPRRIIVALVAGFSGFIMLLLRGPRGGVWLFAAATLVGTASYIGELLPNPDALMPHTGNRYAIVPEALFALAMLAVTGSFSVWRARVAAFLCVWLCAAGVLTLWQPSPFDSGPPWRMEMAKYQKDPHYVPVGWPGGGWVIRLPPVKPGG